MIEQNEITELYQLWSRLPFSRLLVVNQLNEKFKIEFILNTEDPYSPIFLSELQNLTIKKHPAGSVSWIGYWSMETLNSQYKRYKIDFIDSTIQDRVDQEKLGLYVKALKECIRRKLPA